MDDQFNGRTDDDLFADDFEPISETIVESAPHPQQQTRVDSTPAPAPAMETQPTAPASQPSPAPNAPKTLAHSRHAKPGRQQRPRNHSPEKSAPPSTSSAKATTGEASNPSEPSSSSTTTNTATPTPTTAARPGSNTALADRLASGANPRTKLSESELAEKMERMRILSAEKVRKFEQAEQDSRSHALAYEKGMQEARRRRAEEAERRRRGEEERRQMDQERAANRERKLKAMGAREGAWDEGKTAEDERERRGFRGANGGIRGARNIRGADTEEPPIREFAPDEFRGRGRGRGRGGSRGGRGGRGGFADRNAAADGASHSQPQQQKKPEQTPPTADDFPALPSAPKLDTTATEPAKPISLSPGPNSPPIGKWDDEMAALDAKTG
ncbi:hypothetical protein GGR55DRAFT_598442 [Xylaria sp. FL0064]|nr:hypothetical protein GGR55DRAFT_598442 [Xylaria sp. FL0064]